MMKITHARDAAMSAIVLFCRRKKASAPDLIASDTSRIAGVPVSRARTHLMRYPAKARPKRLIARMSPSSVIARFSLRTLERSHVSDRDTGRQKLRVGVASASPCRLGRHQNAGGELTRVQH